MLNEQYTYLKGVKNLRFNHMLGFWSTMFRRQFVDKPYMQIFHLIQTKSPSDKEPIQCPILKSKQNLFFKSDCMGFFN